MGLRAKLTLVIVAVVTIALAAIAWGAARFSESFMSEMIDVRGTRAAPVISAALAAPLAERDYATVQQIIDEMRRDDGIAPIIVFSRDGTPIASTGYAGDTPNPALGETRLFAAEVKVGSQIVGSARYGLSTIVAARLKREMLAFHLKLGAGALAALALVLVAIGIYLTRPLERLAAATSEIRAGRYDVALPRAANDEIGALTAGFSAMAAELKARMRELEQKEQRLTQLLEQAGEREAQLAEAKTAAEAASVAKSRFLTNMSHELRTPLAGVLGMIELVLDTPLDARQRELVTAAHDSGWSLLHLLDELLDVGRHASIVMTLARVRFDLHALVEQTVALFRGRATQKSVKLEARIDATVPAWISGDADRLRQVLANLVGNAVKFTDVGRVDIELTMSAPTRLTLRVRDTGIGIEAHNLERVFEPFVQVDDGPRRRFGGSGLGLSITRQIVAAMGGTVDVTSNPSAAGSTFVCELPIEAIAAPDADAPLRRIASAALVGEVLIVEDNPTNLAVAAAIVQELGCGVTTADSGRAALEAFAARRFDVVLMDCQMPGMDGFETTARMRALERNETRVPQAPIIAITAHAGAADRERCLAAGMDDYIAKPYRRDALERLLAGWLQKDARSAGIE